MTMTLRSMAGPMFLPAMVYEIGNGAIAPVIALTALDLGGSVRSAGFTLALLGVGQILGDLPAGSLAARLGDRRAMLVAAAVSVTASVTCFVAPSLAVLAVAVTVIGMCNAVFYLARLSYLSGMAPPHLRARTMSTLGGVHRVGLFLGPFLGAFAVHQFGLRSAYLVAVGASVAVGVLLVTVPEPGDTGPVAATEVDHRAWRTFARYRSVLLTLGAGMFLVGAVRATRQTALPLWADHIGLSATTTSLVFGIANAVDMCLFYPAGKVMDHFGRLSVAIPSMTILGASLMALPLTHGVVSFTLVAAVMSLGNGIGSGIMMTIGADAAPAQGRTSFLAGWRLVGDTGNASGPVIASTVAVVATLASGIVTVGALGLLAAAVLRAFVPRYSAFATRADVLRSRADVTDSTRRLEGRGTRSAR